MGLIKAFFGQYLTYITLGVLALLLAALGAQTVRLSSAKTDLATLKTSIAEERAQQTVAALKEADANAKETQRRLDRQQESQREQDALVARMRRDRDAAFAVVDRVQKQSADAARQWSDRLGDSASAEDIAAAGAAIAVLTDVRSRLERAGAELASHADPARANGLKCEADYDSLNK